MLKEKQDVKQLIIIRKDLKMRRGKEISQGAHASMKFLIEAVKDGKDFEPYEEKWLFNNEFKKIVLQTDSEEKLDSLYEMALGKGFNAYIIVDNGLTEFNGVPTKTALAIGPNYSKDLDTIAKHLQLY